MNENGKDQSDGDRRGVGWGVTAHASSLLFQANYDGNTTQGGLAADIATGSGVATVVGTVGFAPGKVGTGANFVGGASSTAALQYNAAGNINSAQGTLEFWWNPSVGLTDIDPGTISPNLLTVTDSSNNRFFQILSGHR